MNLVIQRQWLTDKSTGGELLVDGEFQCFTLEPQKDTSRGKPFAIPQGRYQIKLLLSARFEMVTPHVMNVPGFEAIEIHPGNYPRDTEGCTLVGKTRDTDFVGDSKIAFTELMAKILDESWITYLG